jgi:hypothetical protein
MAESHSRRNSEGFSLTEMLVALVFISVLMAGMASVFKASLATSVTSGEMLSSARRNRMSVDVLGNDLNCAELYLLPPNVAPSLGTNNPPFYILPNMPVAGANANDLTAWAQTADQLFFYLDQPLPFQGQFVPSDKGIPASSAVGKNSTVTSGIMGYEISCPGSYANMVQIGQTFIFQDQFEYGYITNVSVAGNVATVTAGTSPLAAVSGQGAAGNPLRFSHVKNANVLFALPSQQVRYSVKMVQLDPMEASGGYQNPLGIPCLVRDQEPYSTSGWTEGAITSTQIITENVAGFKVYLSVDGGQDWEGLNFAGTGFTAGWDTGIRALLDTQLGISGRPGYQTTRSPDPNSWLRNIPTLVRVDLTTRTAEQRSEYSSTPNTLAYKNLTQTVVFLPALSGLPLS